MIYIKVLIWYNNVNVKKLWIKVIFKKVKFKRVYKIGLMFEIYEL